MVEPWRAKLERAGKPEPIPPAVGMALDRGPAAYWYLARPGGALQWANRVARGLAAPGWGEQGDATDADAALGWAVWLEVCREALTVEAPAEWSRAWPRLVQGHPQLWLLTAQVQHGGALLMAVPADAAASHACAASAAHPQQRDLLVREVHHRLKNNLQGVSGLLRQQAAAQPVAAPWLEAAASQLQAMAHVYGVQTAGDASPTVSGLVQAVARGVAGVFGVVIEVVQAKGDTAANRAPQTESERHARALRRTLWAHLEQPPGHGEVHDHPDALDPDQAGALALVLNELMTNAVKHRAPSVRLPGSPDGAAVRCIISVVESGLEIDILNAGQWALGGDWDRVPPGVHGLGLAKALLPSRGAHLQFHTQADLVCARLHIAPPLLRHRLQTP